jgi:hypothetical protein
MIDDSPAALESRIRCLFYFLTIISESEINQTDGLIQLASLVTPRMTDFCSNHGKRLVAVSSCSPTRLKALHLLVRPPKAGRTIASRLLSMMFSLIGDKFGGQTLVHSGETEAEILGKVGRFGLDETGLPEAAGGSWKYEEFNVWRKERILLEQAFEVQGGYRKESELTEAAAKQRLCLTREEWKERRRQQNIIYSRQKRERRKAEMSRAKEQCEELESENKRLKKDNERLERLLSEAKALESLAELGKLSPDDFTALSNTSQST